MPCFMFLIMVNLKLVTRPQFSWPYLKTNEISTWRPAESCNCLNLQFTLLFCFVNNSTARKNVQIRSFFLSQFSRISTESVLRSKSSYSVRIRENTDQKKLRIWALFTHHHLLKTLLKSVALKVFSESCQTSKMELFEKIVNGWKLIVHDFIKLSL